MAFRLLQGQCAFDRRGASQGISLVLQEAAKMKNACGSKGSLSRSHPPTAVSDDCIPYHQRDIKMIKILLTSGFPHPILAERTRMIKMLLTSVPKSVRSLHSIPAGRDHSKGSFDLRPSFPKLMKLINYISEADEVFDLRCLYVV